jgi:hypothetical protein
MKGLVSFLSIWTLVLLLNGLTWLVQIAISVAQGGVSNDYFRVENCDGVQSVFPSVMI